MTMLSKMSDKPDITQKKYILGVVTKLQQLGFYFT